MTAKSFASRLIGWQKKNGRHNLPWQINPTAYRVWVSEIMLQQTQVKTVVPYYTKFMRHLPTVEHLANAPLSAVLELWSGLGYYARARLLHKSAKIICGEHAGVLPDDIDKLVLLPGIGESIAGAILSLAYQKCYAVLDANVRRVLARHADIEGWYGDCKVAKQFWTVAKRRLPKTSAGAYNQAMMDLGALVCTAKNPLCDHCPVQRDCSAYQSGLIAQRPTPKPRVMRSLRDFSVIIVRYRNNVLLEQRPPRGIWGGLLSFPESSDMDSATAWCRRRFGRQNTIQALPQQTYHLTHQIMKVKPLYCRLQKLPLQVSENQRYVWCKMEHAVRGVGTPTLVKRLLKTIEHT